MKLQNISYCRYLTRGNNWNQAQYNAYKIVRAVKGRPFGKYADLQVGGVWKRLTSETPEIAVEWFVDQVAKTTAFPKGIKTFLCPVPDSECTIDGARHSKVLALAEALTVQLPVLTVWNGLRFRRVMPKSSETNMRDENALFEAMVVYPQVPKGHIIILDDVCTSGSHARAAARRLMASGADNLIAMSVARTTQDPNEKSFGIMFEDI